MESRDKPRRDYKNARTIYRIVVDGELSTRYAAAFEEMEMEVGSGQTVLMGEVIDQPRLHGILDRINGLGLKLVSVESTIREPHGSR